MISQENQVISSEPITEADFVRGEENTSASGDSFSLGCEGNKGCCNDKGCCVDRGCCEFRSR
jgi:hypothetical protein